MEASGSSEGHTGVPFFTIHGLYNLIPAPDANQPVPLTETEPTD